VQLVLGDGFVVSVDHPDTVKRHVSHILDKLGAANRTQIIAGRGSWGYYPRTARRRSLMCGWTSWAAPAR
jgi:hypothetical protein